MVTERKRGLEELRKAIDAQKRINDVARTLAISTVDEDEIIEADEA